MTPWMRVLLNQYLEFEDACWRLSGRLRTTLASRQGRQLDIAKESGRGVMAPGRVTRGKSRAIKDA